MTERTRQVTEGGQHGASAEAELTSGGQTVTSGAGRPRWRDPRVVTLVAFGAFGLVYMIVNATTLIDQRAALGRPIEPWRAWLLELTSFVSWLILLPMILWVAIRLLGLKQRWLAVAWHAAACLAASLSHTLLMLGLRAGSFALAGELYARSEPVYDVLVFELRKDIITYVSIVLVFLVARRLLAAPSNAAADSPGTGTPIEVRDGNRTLWIRPDEIDWVSAAGNYVELHGAFGVQLARRTLSDMEEELAGEGFVRVHRSRLVRQASIASIETRQSGDFEVILRTGERITGSRRYRANVRQG